MNTGDFRGSKGPSGSARPDWHRLIAITKILIASSVSALMLLTLDAYFGTSPVHPLNRPVEWLFIGVLAADMLVALFRHIGHDLRSCRIFAWKIRRARHRTKRFLYSNRMLFARAIPLFLAGFAVLWVPEYLIQPLWTDHEHMLVMARFWDNGDFPWVAMHTYQFPGGMETAWISARLFGWGNPQGYFAFNLGMISLVGATMVVWARRNLGMRVYGVLGFFAMVFVEAAQPFTGVSQRDSQTTWLAMIALLAPSAFPANQAGTFVSAVCLALAVAIRPHALIFVPLTICGIFWMQVTPADSIRSRIRYAIRFVVFSPASRHWMICFCISALIFLAPVLGIRRTPAFLNALTFPLTQPGDYSRGAFADWYDVVKDSFARQRNILFLLFCLGMLVSNDSPKWRRASAGMLAIFVCVIVYRAAHPVDHGYMKLPMQYWTCLGAMIFPAWLMTRFRSIPTFTWISLLGGITIAGLPPTPLFVSIGDWPASVRDLAGIRTIEYSPTGAKYAYPRPPVEYHYTWAHVKAVENWLRTESKENTRVLNLLSYQPFPAFLGTVGNLPLGRIESFVMLTWFKKYDFDSEIYEYLVAAPSGSLVIWDNDRTNPVHFHQISRSAEYIRNSFSPAVRIGEIEIWRKP